MRSLYYLLILMSDHRSVYNECSLQASIKVWSSSGNYPVCYGFKLGSGYSQIQYLHIKPTPEIQYLYIKPMPEIHFKYSKAISKMCFLHRKVCKHLNAP